MFMDELPDDDQVYNDPKAAESDDEDVDKEEGLEDAEDVPAEPPDEEDE